MSRPVVKLGDVVDFIGGAQPPKEEFIYEERDEYIRMLQIRDYKSDANKTYIPIKLARRFCTKDDIMIGRYGPPVFQILRGMEGAYNVALMKAEPSGNVDKNYLYHFLKQDSLFRLIDGLSQRTAGQSGVDMDSLKSYPMILPDMPEQKRIAAILDKADAIRRKRQQAIKLADDFLRSVFMEMFGDPVTNPKGWEVKKLGQVSETQLGKMLSEKSKIGTSPKKYLRNANVRWREFDLEDMLEMDFDEREIKKFNLCKGDLLICEGGEIGRCAIWHGQLSECYFQKALHRLRVSPDIFTPEYVQEYFYWMSVNGGLVKSSSEVTFSHLTAEKLKVLDIPVPPVVLQNEFSAVYRKYNELKMKNKNISYVDADVFSALSQKAFSGKL